MYKHLNFNYSSRMPENSLQFLFTTEVSNLDITANDILRIWIQKNRS